MIKRITGTLVLLAAVCAIGQYSVTAACTQVGSYPGEDEDNGGGRNTSRVGNGSGWYSMLVNVDLTGLTITEQCTLSLLQMSDSSDSFDTRVSTVAGNWVAGSGNLNPEEGSVCYKYRAYGSASPTFWIDGDNTSTLNSVSNAQGGSHENSTDLVLYGSSTGLPSYVVLDLALIRDLAGGACHGFRICKAAGQASEISFDNGMVVLNWNPDANPIRVERSVALPERVRAYNGPNPCNSAATIFFTGREAQVSIHDMSGALVRTLSGSNGLAVWDGRDALGRDAASGAYVYRVDLGGKRIVRTLNLVR